MFQLERVYGHLEGPSPRFLVERLWPRGVKKVDLRMDGWLREVAPSTELRRWFGHDPGRWGEFQRRYTAELEAHPDAWAPLLDAGRKDTVTLLFSAHDAEHNNAVVLKDFLDRQLKGRGARSAHGPRKPVRKAQPATSTPRRKRGSSA